MPYQGRKNILIGNLVNAKFKEINNSWVKYLGGLGEYECNKLLTEKKFSLGEIDTIKKVIEFCNSKEDFNYIFNGIFKRNLEFYLRKTNFGKQQS